MTTKRARQPIPTEESPTSEPEVRIGSLDLDGQPPLKQLFYDVEADRLELWPVAHATAEVHASDPRDEIERLVRANGCAGLITSAGALTFGSAEVPRRPVRPFPAIAPGDPHYELVAAVEQSIADAARRTRPVVH